MSTKSKITGLTSFLMRLGIAEENIHPGKLSACPKHPKKGDKLLAIPNVAVPGGYYFRCEYPHCDFSGSAIHLVAATKDVSLREAAKLFLPGEEFAGTLFPQSANSDNDREYLEQVSYDLTRQEEILKYLEEGRMRLRDRSSLIQFAGNQGVRPDAFFESPCSALQFPLPEALAEQFGFQEFKKNEYMFFPYYCGGVLTSLTAYCPCTGASKIVHTSDLGVTNGVFMESALDWPAVDHLVICTGEMDALMLNSRFREIHTSGISTTCLRSPESLALFPKTKAVTLVTHTGSNKLTIEAAIEYSKHTDAKLTVVDVGYPLVQIKTEHIKRLIASGVSVWEWAASRLQMMHTMEGADRVMLTLASTSLTDEEKALLLEHFKEDASYELKETVRRVTCMTTTKMFGDLRFMRTANGYRQLHPSTKRLTNFTLNSQTVTDDAKGQKIIFGDLRTDRPDDPLYPIDIPTKVLTKPGPILSNYIWERLIEQGSTFAPYACTPDGPANFLNLLSVFDTPTYRDYADQLGVHEQIAYFPHVRIDLANQEITASTHRPGSDPLLVRTYGALTAEDDPNLPLFKSLLERAENPCITALMGIIGHIAYHVHTAAFSSGRFHPQHLLIPGTSSEYSIWEVLVRQMSHILSSNTTLPTVPKVSMDFRRFQARYGDLQHLPLICKCQGNNPYFMDWVLTNEIPVIALTDATTAAMLNTSHDVTYIHEDLRVFSSTVKRELIPDKIAVAIRRHLPAFLTQLQISYEDNCIPAVAGYRAMLSAVGLDVEVPELFDKYFTKHAFNTPDAFLVEIRNLLQNGTYRIGDNAIQRKRTSDNTLGGYLESHDCMVLFQKRSMDAVAGNLTGFNTDHLTEQMALMGITVDHETLDRACWFIPMALWEQYVEAPIHTLPAFVEPRVISASDFTMLKAV